MKRRRGLRSPRLARKERRTKNKKIVLFLCAGFLILFALGYTVTMSEFRIIRVSVQGVENEMQAKIVASAEDVLQEKYFGIIPKAYFLLYPRRALSKSLEKQFPLLASVSTALVNLTELEVAVAKRTPVALWCVAEECFYIDKTGFAFGAVETDVGHLYYRLRSLKTQNAQNIVGTEALPPERLVQLLSFFSKLEDLGLSPVEVTFREGAEEEIILQGGSRLLVKEAEELGVVMRRLELLLGEKGLVPRRESTEEISVDYIDLRFGNKIFYKPR